MFTSQPPLASPLGSPPNGSSGTDTLVQQFRCIWDAEFHTVWTCFYQVEVLGIYSYSKTLGTLSTVEGTLYICTEFVMYFSFLKNNVLENT